MTCGVFSAMSASVPPCVVQFNEDTITSVTTSLESAQHSIGNSFTLIKRYQETVAKDIDVVTKFTKEIEENLKGELTDEWRAYWNKSEKESNDSLVVMHLIQHDLLNLDKELVRQLMAINKAVESLNEGRTTFVGSDVALGAPAVPALENLDGVTSMSF